MFDEYYAERKQYGAAVHDCMKTAPIVVEGSQLIQYSVNLRDRQINSSHDTKQNVHFPGL